MQEIELIEEPSTSTDNIINEDSHDILKFTLPVKDLLHVLIFANSVVEKRNVLVELSHIKLVVKNNILEIVATDRDLTLVQQINVQGWQDGQTSVSSSTFTDIIRKIYDKEITIKQKKSSDELEIIGTNCIFKLVTLPANSFPSLEEINITTNFSVPCKEFAHIIENTEFSMSNEETRYNLNGIYLHNTNSEQQNFLHAAATDGHRLASSATIINNLSGDTNIILPKKTINELIKIIKDPQNINSILDISLNVNKVKFVCNQFIMVSKLIDGTFPEYEQLIPKQNKNILNINNKLLSSSIDRVSTITNDKFRAIKITMNNKNLTISAFGEAKGSAKEVLPHSTENESMCSYEGDELSIGFNPRYLLDVLSLHKDAILTISLNNPFSPILIKFNSSPQDSFVIMPIKI